MVGQAVTGLSVDELSRPLEKAPLPVVGGEVTMVGQAVIRLNVDELSGTEEKLDLNLEKIL